MELDCDLIEIKGQLVTQTIENFSVALKNIEESFLISGTTLGYKITARGNSAIQLTHVALESGSKFIKIFAANQWVETNTFKDITLYFQTSKDTEVVEIVYYTPV